MLQSSLPDALHLLCATVQPASYVFKSTMQASQSDIRRQDDSATHQSDQAQQQSRIATAHASHLLTSSPPVLLGSETWESVILQSQVVAKPAAVTILDIPWQNLPAMKQSLEKDWVLVPRHFP